MRGNERLETGLKRFLQAACSLPPEDYTAGLGSGNLFLGGGGRSQGLLDAASARKLKPLPAFLCRVLCLRHSFKNVRFYVASCILPAR
jgi:hypothetical protein